MQLRVYNGEFFQRSSLRYAVFVLVLVGMVLVSFFMDNRIGAFFLLILTGGYWYLQTRVGLHAQIELTETGVKIKDRLLPYAQLQGFLFEAEAKTGKVLNIVFVFKKHTEIFTIDDEIEQIQLFAQHLSAYVPTLDNYPQTMIEMLMRKLKI